MFKLMTHKQGVLEIQCSATAAAAGTAWTLDAYSGKYINNITTTEAGDGQVVITLNDSYVRLLGFHITQYGVDGINCRYLSEDVDHATTPVINFHQRTQSTDAAAAGDADPTTSDKYLISITLQTVDI